MNFESEHLKHSSHLKDYVKLPSEGLSGEEILKIVGKNVGLGDNDWRDGSQSGTVYNGNL